MVPSVDEPIEVLERRIERLRAALREAVLAGDREHARALRAELGQAERAWDEALEQAAAQAPARAEAPAPAEGPAPAEVPAREQGSLLPLREQVHQALSLLTVPASPRLIATVHEAFFTSTFPNARLTSLRRDEERSFRSAPFARPYYVCAALTADLLAPARGLLAISTWPMERRVIGSLSPRVDFLSAAIQVAEAIERLPAPVPAARRLLWRFAASIPGAADSAKHMEPHMVTRAARAELDVHEPADQGTRRAAAARARAQLDDAQQLFGSRLAASADRRRNRT
jgi:hypothetical protein